jgi:hypothetical protein
MSVQIKIPFCNRRSVLASLLSIAALPACTQPLPERATPIVKTLTSDEQRFKHKFRGLGGGELFVDAFGEKHGVVIFNEKGQEFFARGVSSPRNNNRHGYGAEFGVPITLRATWREGGVPGSATETPWNSKLIGDVTVPVAERIPDAILDRVRKYGGTFVLKLRLTDETLLIGWEVKNGRGYPYKKDRVGNAYETEEDRMRGGDFCELQMRDILVDGVVDSVRTKGWYIDKKTGKKIETDF